MKQQLAQPVGEQAAAWFARVQDAPGDAPLRAELEHWLAQAPQHREEYQRLVELWRAADFIPDNASKPCAAPSLCASCRAAACCARPWPPG